MERVLLLVFYFPVFMCMLYIDVPLLISVMHSLLSPDQSSTTLIGKVKSFLVKVPTPEILPQLTNSFSQEGKGKQINCCAE